MPWGRPPNAAFLPAQDPPYQPSTKTQVSRTLFISIWEYTFTQTTSAPIPWTWASRKFAASAQHYYPSPVARRVGGVDHPPPAPLPVDGHRPLTARSHHRNQPAPAPPGSARHCPRHASNALGGSGTHTPAAAHAYQDNSNVVLRWLPPAGPPPPTSVPLPLPRLPRVGGGNPRGARGVAAGGGHGTGRAAGRAAPGGPRQPRTTSPGTSAGQGGRPRRPGRCSCRPAPGRGPGCTRGRSRRPGQPRHSTWHAAGARYRLRAVPGRLSGDRHGRGRRQGGRQVRRPQQAQPHPHQRPQAVPPPRPPTPRGGRGPSAPRLPSARRRASRCRSCSGLWSRRGGGAIGRGGVPATGARAERQRATEGGWYAEEGEKRQGRAKARAAAPEDEHKGRASALATTREGRGTGRAPVQAAAGENRHMGQARARAAEGTTQGTARGTGRGRGRTRAPAEKARARVTERDTRHGQGGRREGAHQSQGLQAGWGPRGREGKGDVSN